MDKNKTEQAVIDALEKELCIEGDSMGVVEVVGLALKVFDSLLQKMPDYDQQKKNKYYRLKKDYIELLHAEQRDMNLLLQYRDELILMVSTYADEIGGKQ